MPAPHTPIEKQPDVVIVPGLAFTRQGQRLGMGGGYYDRYLQSQPDTFSVGVCYDWQVLDKLPLDTHDRPMNTLVTNTDTISCTG